MKSIAVVALCMFAAVAGEAEASADAGHLYGYYGYPYARYGHYYGKRSADAEPTAAYGKRSADAEPTADAAYAHYGYGHHLGYAHHGYYGYPYAHHYGHYYGK